MKSIMTFMIVIVMVVVTFVVATSSVHAGGDKVRGEGSEGPAYQLGDCPFTG